MVSTEAPVRTEARMQRTIAQPAERTGVGLHTGEEVTVRINPAPPGTGIVFYGVPALIFFASKAIFG